MQSERPSHRFLEVLNTLLTQRRVILLHRDQAPVDPSPGIEVVGWLDEEYIYLDPVATYNRIVRFCRDEGEPFPVKWRTLYSHLAEEALLVRDKDRRSTVTEWLSGSSRRVLKIPREALSVSDEVSRQEAV